MVDLSGQDNLDLIVLTSIWEQFERKKTANLDSNILQVRAATATTVNHSKEKKRERNSSDSFL